MNKQQQSSKDDQQQFWQMVFETWRDSGMSVSKFCKAEGLSEGSFYNWRKKLTRSDESAEDKQKELAPSCLFGKRV